jgi:hypothetical protein
MTEEYKQVKAMDPENPDKHIALGKQPADRKDKDGKLIPWVGIVLHKGDSIENLIFVGEHSWDKPDNKGKLYKFEDADDREDRYFIYSTSSLENVMDKIPYEANVKIEYLGKKPSKKNPKFNYHDINVYKK